MMEGVLNIVEGKAFREAYGKLSSETLGLSSDDLLQMFKPTKTDYALRSSFWNEFRLSSLTMNKLILKRVYTGICTYQHFYHNVLNNQYKLAWLIQPYNDYLKEIEPLIMKSVERLDDILNLPIMNSKNEVDSKSAKLVLDAIKMIDSKVIQESKNILPGKEKSICSREIKKRLPTSKDFLFIEDSTSS